MASKDRKRGHELELHVGRLLGGRRRRNGEGGGYDDCVLEDEHGNARPMPISIECKSYSVLQLRGPWVEQATRNAGDRPWLIAQRPKGSRRIYATLDLATLRDPKFLELMLELATNQTEENRADIKDAAAHE